MKAELTIEDLMADSGFELKVEDDEQGRLRYWQRYDGSRVEAMDQDGLPMMVYAVIQTMIEGELITSTLSTRRLDLLAKLLNWQIHGTGYLERYV